MNKDALMHQPHLCTALKLRRHRLFILMHKIDRMHHFAPYWSSRVKESTNDPAFESIISSYGQKYGMIYHPRKRRERIAVCLLPSLCRRHGSCLGIKNVLIDDPDIAIINQFYCFQRKSYTIYGYPCYDFCH